MVYRTKKKNDEVVEELPYGVPYAIHYIIFPLTLMTLCPIAVILFWVIVTYYNGSIMELASKFELQQFLEQIPRPSLQAFQYISAFVVVEALLLALVPGKTFYGPISPAGVRPKYRQNGVACFFLIHMLLYLAAYHFHLFSPSAVFQAYGSILMTLCVGSYFINFLLYLKGSYFSTDKDAGTTGHFIMDLYWGVERHPTFLGLNLKQFVNCRVGMMAWSVLLCVFALQQYEIYGYISNSMLLSVGLQLVYLFKFFWWETGYFTSIDIMHDKFGFMIYWGITVWVPSVYVLVGFYLVRHPLQWELWQAVAIFLLGVASIYFNYEADYHRQLVRETNGKCKVWGKKPVVIDARYQTADGKIHENLLLVSGWWGVARHVHYVFELLLTLAWTIPVGFDNYLPYFYLTFLTVLLLHRAGRDEKRCQLKYTTYWSKYMDLVPYRLIPFIF